MRWRRTVRNTSAEVLAKRAERARARSARARAKAKAVKNEASDAGTRIERLCELIERHPASVLANPAWELAMVTDPALLGRLDDAKLALVAGHASADATTLALFANEVVRRSQGQFMSTPTAASLAVATRADAPVEALRALAGIGNPRRMGVPGVEVARHRVKCFEKGDVEMVGGWRDALPAVMVEVGRTADRAGHWAVDQGYTPRLVERGAARAAHPFLLGLFAGATSPSRRAMLELVRLRGHDVDERWLWTVAAVEAGAGARNDRVSEYLWRACVSWWDGDFSSYGMSTRCAPQSFAEAQYLGIRNQRISAWVASLRCHEDARRFGAAMPPVTVSGDGLDDHVYVGGPFLTGVVNGNLLAWLAIECKQAAALARRARDPRWWVRAAVAMNVTVDAALREQLCGDHHWVVRGMAREAREAAGRVAAASGAAA
jgi:hypothetical protein